MLWIALTRSRSLESSSMFFRQHRSLKLWRDTAIHQRRGPSYGTPLLSQWFCYRMSGRTYRSPVIGSRSWLSLAPTPLCLTLGAWHFGPQIKQEADAPLAQEDPPS